MLSEKKQKGIIAYRWTVPDWVLLICYGPRSPCAPMNHLLKIISFPSKPICPHVFPLTQSFEWKINKCAPIERRQHTLCLWHRPEFNLSLMFSTAVLVWQRTRSAVIHVCHWILNVLICEVVFWQTLVQNVINGLVRKPCTMHAVWTFCGGVWPSHCRFHRSSWGHWEWLNGNLTWKQTEESFGKRRNTVTHK